LRRLSIALFFAGSACAQHLGFGIKGGVPLTDAFSVGSGAFGLNTSAHYTADRTEYTIGPMVQLRLPLIGFEADALYKPLGYTAFITPTVAPPTTTHVQASSWEFPILAQVHLPTPILKPYAEGGVSFRSFIGSHTELDAQSNKGFVLGAGLEIKIPFLRIGPELRFTRWGSGGFRGLATSTLLESSQNQFEFLIGISR
jgi:hypothetical protein